MSIKQFLIIHKFPTLFTILNEIKSNLNFNVEHIIDNKLLKDSEDRNFLILIKLIKKSTKIKIL